MGNNQPGGINKRERPGDGYSAGATTPGRHRTFSGNPQSISNAEDGCPVQVCISSLLKLICYYTIYHSLRCPRPNNSYTPGLQVKIAKSDDDLGAITPTVQFKETNEYPVVFKWHCSATRLYLLLFFKYVNYHSPKF
uniref:MSP domain-containing protein n=1 Tax=Heterorhabditis bacteriophora TaxID=37862 RepID=A0A1I7W6Z3_HETBA